MEVWYRNYDNKPQGPYSKNEMNEFISRGIISRDELIFERSANEWKKAMEWPQLQSDLSQVEYVSRNLPHENLYVLYRSAGDGLFRHTGLRQIGPLNRNEFDELLFEGKITTSDHVWFEGLKDWKMIGLFHDIRIVEVLKKANPAPKVKIPDSPIAEFEPELSKPLVVPSESRFVISRSSDSESWYYLLIVILIACLILTGVKLLI